MPDPTRVIILGAAGRDFHDFNVHYRGNPAYRVMAFTATQIPDIEGRVYPPELAGPAYPEGIPIHAEAELPRLEVEEPPLDRIFDSQLRIGLHLLETGLERFQVPLGASHPLQNSLGGIEAQGEKNDRGKHRHASRTTPSFITTVRPAEAATSWS